VEGTQPGKILRSRLLQLYVFADNTDDIGLLLDGISKIPRIRHEVITGIVRQSRADPLCRSCGIPILSVDRVGKSGSISADTRLLEAETRLEFAMVYLVLVFTDSHAAFGPA
jgi:hypothetical protein